MGIGGIRGENHADDTGSLRERPGAVRHADRSGLGLPVAVGDRLDGALIHALVAQTPVSALPEPSLVPEPVQPSQGSVEDLICSYSWDCGAALRIFTCESGLRPDAISYNGTSFGITQLWSGHAYRWPTFWSEWSDPVINIAWAFELYQEQGFTPWECW